MSIALAILAGAGWALAAHLNRQLRKTREAFKRHARHRPRCGVYFAGSECDCGLDNTVGELCLND